MSFDFFPNEQTATLLNAARHPALTPDPGPFTNFFSGAGSYAMRGLAEAGRAVDMAGAAFPVFYDAVTGGTEQQDQYFKEHDDVFNNAVDAWTPRPGEVGTAGQITGQLAGGVMQAVVSPALLVGSAQMGTSEDLVRQGVDASQANTVGVVAGLGAAAGLKLPFLGSTLASKVASGAVGNAAQGFATAGASHAILNASGFTAQAAQFEPMDARGRVLDAMLGAAFGGLAHVGARAELRATDEAALLVSNQARHLEETTAPGRPVAESDLMQHVNAMREAIDQTLRGEPVSVDHTIEGMRMEPDPVADQARTEVGDEMARLSAEEAPPAEPIRDLTDASMQRTTTGTSEDLPAGMPDDMTASRARAVLEQNPDMTIPTGRFDTDGNAEHVRVADVMAHNDVETAQTVATAGNLYRTAAACLLGVL